MKLLSTLVLAAGVALTSCAAKVVKTPANSAAPSMRAPADAAAQIVLNVRPVTPTLAASEDWGQLRADWNGAFFAAAGTAGIPLTVQEGAPRPTGQPGTLLAVTIKDYRYVSTGKRFGLGIMSGNAFVEASVRFVNLRDGSVYGEEQINTSSSAWEGLFSALLDEQIKAIAKDVVADVKPAAR